MLKRILCDADGVFLDFIGALCREFQARGRNIVPSDIKHWDLKHSLDAETTREAYAIMATPGFCHSIEWYDGARKFFDEASLEGELHVLTAPANSPTWMHERKESIAATGFPWDRVHFIGGKYKHHFSGDVLIEDHPGNAAAWLDANRNGSVILIDRPWNQPSAVEWESRVRMYRVTSFQAALTTLRECL